MTTHLLRRWGAVLIAGGLCASAAYLFFPADPASPLLQPAAALALVGVLLMVPGLAAFQRAQSGRAAGLGWSGAGLLMLGLTVLEVPHCVIALVDLQRMQDLDAYHASLPGRLEFPAIVCIALGEILLLAAIWRSRTYPRWTAWLMLVNIAVSVLGTAVPSVAIWLRVPAPNYLLCGLIGLAMLRLASLREELRAADPATAVVA